MNGIVRPMDMIGRVVIPIEIRDFIPKGTKCDITWDHTPDYQIIRVHLEFNMADPSCVKGILRAPDALGRLVIPAEIRNFIPAGTKCDITWDHTSDYSIVWVHLHFCVATCPICAQPGPLWPIGQIHCCSTCYSKLIGGEINGK